jgi:hypothetical protein
MRCLKTVRQGMSILFLVGITGIKMPLHAAPGSPATPTNLHLSHANTDSFGNHSPVFASLSTTSSLFSERSHTDSPYSTTSTSSTSTVPHLVLPPAAQQSWNLETELNTIVSLVCSSKQCKQGAPCERCKKKQLKQFKLCLVRNCINAIAPEWNDERIVKKSELIKNVLRGDAHVTGTELSQATLQTCLERAKQLKQQGFFITASGLKFNAKKYTPEQRQALYGLETAEAIVGVDVAEDVMQMGPRVQWVTLIATRGMLSDSQLQSLPGVIEKGLDPHSSLHTMVCLEDPAVCKKYKYDSSYGCVSAFINRTTKPVQVYLNVDDNDSKTALKKSLDSYFDTVLYPACDSAGSELYSLDSTQCLSQVVNLPAVNIAAIDSALKRLSKYRVNVDAQKRKGSFDPAGELQHIQRMQRVSQALQIAFLPDLNPNASEKDKTIMHAFGKILAIQSAPKQKKNKLAHLFSCVAQTK